MKIDSYICKSWSLSKNKAIEFQFSRWRDAPLFDVDYWYRTKQDHPGLEFGITLFKYELHIDFYDKRHWNEKLCIYE